jgi:hypothetical protein
MTSSCGVSRWSVCSRRWVWWRRDAREASRRGRRCVPLAPTVPACSRSSRPPVVDAHAGSRSARRRSLGGSRSWRVRNERPHRPRLHRPPDGRDRQLHGALATGGLGQQGDGAAPPYLVGLREAGAGRAGAGLVRPGIWESIRSVGQPSHDPCESPSRFGPRTREEQPNRTRGSPRRDSGSGGRATSRPGSGKPPISRSRRLSTRSTKSFSRLGERPLARPRRDQARP